VNPICPKHTQLRKIPTPAKQLQTKHRKYQVRHENQDWVYPRFGSRFAARVAAMVATQAMHQVALAIRDAAVPTSRKISYSLARSPCHGSRVGLRGQGFYRAGVCRAAAVSVEPTALPMPAKGSVYEITTFTTWLLKQEQAGVIDGELTIVLSSVALACKQIASLVKRAGISNLTGLQGAANIQGEDQKKLDVISNEVGLPLPLG